MADMWWARCVTCGDLFGFKSTQWPVLTCLRNHPQVVGTNRLEFLPVDRQEFFQATYVLGGWVAVQDLWGDRPVHDLDWWRYEANGSLRHEP